MEIPYINDSLRRWVPRFAQNLQILLVDHDTESLMKVAGMLGKLSFKVTAVALAYEALSMIEDPKRPPFDVVMANVALKDMAVFKFIPIVLQKDIPVILMASNTDVGIARKAVSEGAATHYYEKPIGLERLKYVWRHAYIKRANPLTLSLVIGGTNAEVDVQKGKGKGKVEEVVMMPLLPDKSERLPRPEWNKELHYKFKAALLELGEGASARAIQKKMGVPGLSQYQITTYRERYNALKAKSKPKNKTATWPPTNPSKSSQVSSTPTMVSTPTLIMSNQGERDPVGGNTSSSGNPTIQNNSPTDGGHVDLLEKLLEDDHDLNQEHNVDPEELDEFSEWLLKSEHNVDPKEYDKFSEWLFKPNP